MYERKSFMIFIFMPIQILFLAFSIFYWIDFQVLLKYQGDDISIPFGVMISAVNINFIFILFELFLSIFFFYKRCFEKLIFLFLLVKLLILSVVIYFYYVESLNFRLYSLLFLVGSIIFSMLYFIMNKLKKREKYSIR